MEERKELIEEEENQETNKIESLKEKYGYNLESKFFLKFFLLMQK